MFNDLEAAELRTLYKALASGKNKKLRTLWVTGQRVGVPTTLPELRTLVSSLPALAELLLNMNSLTSAHVEDLVSLGLAAGSLRQFGLAGQDFAAGDVARLATDLLSVHPSLTQMDLTMTPSFDESDAQALLAAVQSNRRLTRVDLLSDLPTAKAIEDQCWENKQAVTAAQ
jgi:hypothetical protein